MTKDFYVVGLGASAGGLAALTTFFDHISPKIPVAFIIATHLLREHRSKMNEILARHTDLPVIRIEKDMKIEPANIYLLIENQTIVVLDHMLQTRTRNEDIINCSIDTFFVSLAKTFKSKAIGIIFSGAGNDGLHGTNVISENGGFVMVQQPESADVKGMPESIVKEDHPAEIDSPEGLAATLNSMFGL